MRFKILLLTCAALVTSTTGIFAAEVDQSVVDYFKANYAEKCFMDIYQEGSTFKPVLLDIGPEWPKISQFVCNTGAYNYVHVYLKSEAIGSITPLHFPRVDVNGQGKVKGILSTEMIINSNYDSEKGIIFEFSKWRGIGDASSYSEYQFDEETNWVPVLVKTEVDATFDGEINPKIVFEVE